MQAYKATKGNCVFASGSPFAPLNLNVNEVPPHTSTYIKPGQANNSYIFPGVILAIVSMRIQPVTDEDFITAAETLSESVTDLDLFLGSLFPPLEKIREVSYEIACQVAHSAFKEGRCHLRSDLREEEIDGIVKQFASFPDPLVLSSLDMFAYR